MGKTTAGPGREHTMQKQLQARRRKMLTQDVRGLTLRIAAPSLAALLASSLGSLLDALVLSRGNTQLSAAVSVSFSIQTMIQTIGFTLGMGAGSFVSRSLGRGEEKEARQVSSTALATALVLCLALCALGAFFTAPLLSLLGAPPEVLPAGVPYARYVLLSGPALCGSLVLSSLLRAQGRTLPNMAAFVLGSALGVGLLWLLAVKGNMGVHGAGIAMLAREGLTLLLLSRALLKDETLIRPGLREVRPSLTHYRRIMRSGLPTLLRQGVMSLSSVLLSHAGAAFGQDALAGMGLAVRAATLVSSAVIGFGQGFQPVCGFNFGAGKLDRCRQAYRFCQKAVFAAMVAVGALFYGFAAPLLSLFGAEPGVVQFGAAVLRAQSLAFFAMGAVIMMNMLTQAMGMTVRASLVATSRQGIFLIPLLLILPRLFGRTGLILAQSVSDLLALALSFLLTRNLFARDAGLLRQDARKDAWPDAPSPA